MAGVGTKRAASPAQAISPPPTKRKIESTVTKKTVAAFFTPTSKKKPEPITWRVIDNSLVVGKYAHPEERRRPPSSGKQKVAAFDLDSTLITTASGRTFATSPTDWKWWDPAVPRKLRALHSEGYQVVVMSNQGAIKIQKQIKSGKSGKSGKSDSKSLGNFKEKVSIVLCQLALPMSVYAAVENDENRKPRPGMWREFLDDYDLDVQGVDLANSIFVGDAAGRPGDHSCVDRDFAANIGIQFKTPEEFFLNEPPQAYVRKFEPCLHLEAVPDEAGPVPFIKRNPLELVVFCGSPGAGKSTFYWRHLQPLGYERVNQDTLKTRDKCLKVAREHIAAGRSVAVDNTNADAEVRKYWIDLAKEMNVPIRCVQFTAPPELCRHNAAVRAATPTMNPESRPSLPPSAFYTFANRFREPSLDEGFQEICRVGFRFHGTDTDRAAWGQYWEIK